MSMLLLPLICGFITLITYPPYPLLLAIFALLAMVINYAASLSTAGRDVIDLREVDLNIRGHLDMQKLLPPIKSLQSFLPTRTLLIE